MGVIAKGILRGCQGLFTPVSLRYPLSVFNKNSTLKQTPHMHERCHEHKFVNIRKQNLGSFSSFTRRLKKSTNTQKNIKIQHLCKNLPSDPNIRSDPEKKIEKIH
jgi:hypothetical protein